MLVYWKMSSENLKQRIAAAIVKFTKPNQMDSNILLIEKAMVSHWQGNKWHFNKGTDVRDLFMVSKVLKRMKAE